jgi:hypothetical protein
MIPFCIGLLFLMYYYLIWRPKHRNVEETMWVFLSQTIELLFGFIGVALFSFLSLLNFYLSVNTACIS